MRAVQLALLILTIQLGLGFVATFGEFGNIPYESGLTNVDLPNQPATTETEQNQFSFNIMNKIFQIVTWGWIKDFFIPWYDQDANVKALVDFIINSLKAVTGIVLGVAFIEFVRNRINVLG